jgi:excisionase family DNA binding protein
MVYTEALAFNRREAADVLRVSLRTVDYLLAQGNLRGRRIGRRIVIPKTEIDRLLRRDTPIDHPIPSQSALREEQ